MQKIVKFLFYMFFIVKEIFKQNQKEKNKEIKENKNKKKLKEPEVFFRYSVRHKKPDIFG